MRVPKLPDLTTLSTRNKLILAGVVIAIVIILTLTGAWYLWRPAPKVPDNKPAAAVAQPDGSVVLEKRPDADLKPVHQIPKGGKVEREIQVIVAPSAPPVAGKCPEVKVNLSLVRNEDKTKRVVASSPDGAVISGLDIPVEDAVSPPEPKVWAVGGAYSSKGEIGAFVDRDLGWTRLGVQINETKDGQSRSGFEGWVKAGIRF